MYPKACAYICANIHKLTLTQKQMRVHPIEIYEVNTKCLYMDVLIMSFT